MRSHPATFPCQRQALIQIIKLFILLTVAIAVAFFVFPAFSQSNVTASLQQPFLAISNHEAAYTARVDTAPLQQQFGTWWTAGGAIILWRWLKFEIPSAFNWLQDYCNGHDGGIIEMIFHKIFGKTKSAGPLEPAAVQPTVKQ